MKPQDRTDLIDDLEARYADLEAVLERRYPRGRGIYPCIYALGDIEAAIGIALTRINDLIMELKGQVPDLTVVRD